MSDKLREGPSIDAQVVDILFPLEVLWRTLSRAGQPHEAELTKSAIAQTEARLRAALAGACEVERAVAQARLDEANWWVPLVPNGISISIEGQRNARIALLERALGATSKPVEGAIKGNG